MLVGAPVLAWHRRVHVADSGRGVNNTKINGIDAAADCVSATAAFNKVRSD